MPFLTNIFLSDKHLFSCYFTVVTNFKAYFLYPFVNLVIFRIFNIEIRGDPHRTDNRDVIIILGTILSLIYICHKAIVTFFFFFWGRVIYIAYVCSIIYVSNTCHSSHYIISQLICFEPLSSKMVAIILKQIWILFIHHQMVLVNGYVCANVSACSFLVGNV